ncbi:sugar kinase [Alkalihalobacillus sp. BA299]|uniref:sugar kinase n=1 Tax=Alkalihalobacillus sp. BA299 TaxID=2815938 RepID=UPI001ADBC69F|nr:sugar kinase [Alkalihalobacillus sp. BA299]
MAEIITIGEILVEIMAKDIGQKFDETGDFVGPFPSGAPAIFIDQAAKCGSNTLIISAVGNDGFGKINIDRLKTDGVDTSSIKVLETQTTGVAFVTYKDNGDRDFIFHISNAACGKINESYIKEEEFMNCNYFHIMGSAIYNKGVYNAILKGIKLSKKNGTKISFDPNVRKEIINDIEKRNLLVDILYQSHIVLAGEKELFYLTGVEDEQKSVELLINNGTEIVVIKRGSRGSTLYTKDLIELGMPYKVDEIDPTGAGDCFGGTFISCINQGVGYIEAMNLASIAGAKAVTKKGPMEGNTNLNELKKIYKEFIGVK